MQLRPKTANFILLTNLILPAIIVLEIYEFNETK